LKYIEQQQLISVLKRFAERKLLLIGDAIADRFLYGSISRVSREAPVFILKHEQTETVPGGAANCALNLASLGARVSLVSVAGKDEAGLSLKQKLLGAKVDVDGLYLDESLNTVTKVRILAGQTHSTRQQVIRIDYEDDTGADSNLRSRILDFIRMKAQEVDAVVLSDYNYGTIDDAVIEVIREIARSRGIPVLVDSRFRLTSFGKFTSATPNEDEVENLVGRRLSSVAELESAAQELKQKLDFEALLVTRGSRGMMLLERDLPPLHVPAVGADQPVDVTGAGDTVIATFALSLSSGASFVEATSLANYAGGLVVMKRGTACVTPEELEHSILRSGD
jgi:rfaE bifunctional protein kinase chain/domain